MTFLLGLWLGFGAGVLAHATYVYLRPARLVYRVWMPPVTRYRIEGAGPVIDRMAQRGGW